MSFPPNTCCWYYRYKETNYAFGAWNWLSAGRPRLLSSSVSFKATAKLLSPTLLCSKRAALEILSSLQGTHMWRVTCQSGPIPAHSVTASTVNSPRNCIICDLCHTPVGVTPTHNVTVSTLHSLWLHSNLSRISERCTEIFAQAVFPEHSDLSTWMDKLPQIFKLLILLVKCICLTPRLFAFNIVYI